MRAKHRYIFVKPFPEDVRLDKSDVWKAIQSSLRSLVGTLGYADANPYLIRVQKNLNGLVIRCDSKQVRTLVAAIALIKDIGGENVSLDVIRVSGTLKAMLKKLKY